MEVVGFCDIKKDATTCKGALLPDEFIGKRCQVMEFEEDGGVLVLNPQCTALAMFDKEDIARSFKCKMVGNTICPPNLNMLQEMEYISRCTLRKGGYNLIVKNMVIEASLMKGTFTDSFLWAKQMDY